MTDPNAQRTGDGPDDRPQYGIRLTPEEQAEHQARLDQARQAREAQQAQQWQRPQYGQPPQGQQPQDQSPYGQPPQGGQHSPYGQPPQYSPYGQPPQPGLYQQLGQTAHPGHPGQLGQQPFGPIERPKTIDRSYWFILAAGLAFILIEAVSLFSPTMGLTPEMMEAYRQQFDNTGVGLDFDAMLPTVRVVAAVFTAILAALYWVIATGIRRGSNTARIFGTILAAMSLLSAFGFGLIYVGLGVAGIVFAYLKPSSEYLRAKAWEKAMRR